MEPLRDEALTVVALGRPFTLGMLYDCRSDKLTPGLSLWDRERLDRDIRVIPKPNSEFRIVASDSFSDKSSSLGVDSSLKASFLSGLVSVGGSAKYLNDSKRSTKQARVTLQYKTTTVFKTLTMEQLGAGNLQHIEVIDHDLATHVVTGILYGAQAFFVFDQETSETESLQDIQGNLKMMIEKIPFISIQGEGALRMEDTDREKVNKVSCTFHGDVLLENSPRTFEEAVRVYRDLPKLLGSNGENAVPLTVFLLPLSALDSRASKLVRQISLRLVTEAENILESCTELELWCNDVLNSTEGQNFSELFKKIQTFNALCSEFKLGLQQTLAQKLPSIRAGAEEETALVDVLKKAAQSPFSSHRLKQWMKDKEKEVNTIKAIIKLSVNSSEPLLSELDQFLKRPPSNSSDAPASKHWCSSTEATDDQRDVTVTALSPNTEHSVRVRAVSTRTSPCSPTEELRGTPSSTDISVSWRRAAQVGQGVNIHSCTVEFGQTQDKVHWKTELSQTEDNLISGLKPETSYTITVQCDCGENDLSPTITVTTTSSTSAAHSSTTVTTSAVPSLSRDISPRPDPQELLKSVWCDFVNNVSDVTYNRLLDVLFQKNVMSLEETDSARAKDTAQKARYVLGSVIKKGRTPALILMHAFCLFDPHSELCEKLRPQLPPLDLDL